MKAVFLDFATLGPDLDLTPLTETLPDLQIFDHSHPADVAARIADAEFVFCNKVHLSDELLLAAPELRFVGLTATGTDNVNLDAARRHDVAVTNIRAYCTRSVAEHVLGCLLLLTHNLHRYNAAVRAGDWEQAEDFCLLAHPVRELSAMTLGIVGYGELGRGVAETAAAFGMRIVIAARPGSDSVPEGRVSFAELLATSDAISLHCPLVDATRNLFGRAEFQSMKRDAILINTARGGLVDSAALADALRNGEIAAAAIDVLPSEPPVDGDPLLDYLKEPGRDNLLVTPHVAWASHEARQAAIDELAANVRAFLNGEERNRVA